MPQTEPAAREAERAALARAVDGDQDAFAELVGTHERMVYSIAWHFFGDRALADDLAQDVFLQLSQNLAAIESEAHLVFWLRQVTSRRCIDQARWLEKRRHPSLDEVAEPHTAGDGGDFLERDRLRRLVRALPEKLRIVVTLRYQEEMPPAEIAAVLGEPVNSIKSRLHRALGILRQRMGGRAVKARWIDRRWWEPW